MYRLSPLVRGLGDEGVKAAYDYRGGYSPQFRAPGRDIMIRVTNTIALGEDEIEEQFIRSSGPGGQNVNKLATAVQLRFDVARSPNLPEPVRERLRRLAGRRLTGDGVLIIDARRHRTRERNRRDALERLVALVRKAAIAPTPRKATRPTAASKRRRLEGKQRRGALKRGRRSVKDPDE